MHTNHVIENKIDSENLSVCRDVAFDIILDGIHRPFLYSRELRQLPQDSMTLSFWTHTVGENQYKWHCL